MSDEPTASLDPAHQHRAMQTARELTDRGKGVIAVVHDFNLAARYADRLVVPARGRLNFDGLIADGLTQARLADVVELEVEIIANLRGGRSMIIPIGTIDGDARAAGGR